MDLVLLDPDEIGEEIEEEEEEKMASIPNHPSYVICV